MLETRHKIFRMNEVKNHKNPEKNEYFFMVNSVIKVKTF